MGLSLPQAELIGTFLELLGYGSYVVVFVECIAVLYRKSASQRAIRYLLSTALLIFALVTTHMIVDLTRATHAFAGPSNLAGAPALYYGNITTTLNFTKSVTYVAVTLISDALIVYRAFVVWERRWLVAVIPSLFLVADIGTSAWALWSQLRVKAGDDVLAADVTLRVKYFYAVTLALNLICAVLISWRIWTIHRGVCGHAAGGVKMMNVIQIILESAALYSACLVALIATSALSSESMFFFLNAIPPIIGLVFSWVIVRASKDYHTTTTFMSTGISFATPYESDTTGFSEDPTDTSKEVDSYRTLLTV